MFRNFLNKLSIEEQNYLIFSKRVFQFLRDQGCLSADDDKEYLLISKLKKSKNFKSSTLVFLLKTEESDILDIIFYNDPEIKELYYKKF